jgi:hypothetical protein
MKKNETVAIGWIDGGMVHSGFIAYLSQIILNRQDFVKNVIVASGPYLSANRNYMYENFLATGDDWLLCLDSDLCIDLNSFDVLIEAADKDKCPILGGKYFLPFDNGTKVVVAAQKLTGADDNSGQFLTPEDIASANGGIITGLHSVGAGYALIHKSVLKKIQDAYPSERYPWTSDYYRESWKGWLSDDIPFYEKVRELEIPVALHTGATSDHLKTFKVNNDVFLTWNALHKNDEHKHEHNHHAPHKRQTWWTRSKKDSK